MFIIILFYLILNYNSLKIQLSNSRPILTTDKGINNIAQNKEVGAIQDKLSLANIQKDNQEESNVNVYGMIYSPYRDGSCATQSQIDQDIQLISPHTGRLHLYGMDCNQTEMILSSIERLAPNMQVMLGMWIRGQNRFELEVKELIRVLHNRKHLHRITGICVGNEELFTKSFTKSELIGMLKQVKSISNAMQVNIPVFTTEIPSLWDKELAMESDALLLNIHPYFDHNLHRERNAALRVLDQYKKFQENYSYLNKPIIIGETGWPNAGSQVENTGQPKFEEQESFFKSLTCMCERFTIPYYLFEAYDSNWKAEHHGAVEKHFGLFSKDRKKHFRLKLKKDYCHSN